MRRITEKDLADIIGTVNAGYTIVRAKTKSDDRYGTIFGENGDRYAVWEFNFRDGETPNIYWGFYTGNEKTALENYEARG